MGFWVGKQIWPEVGLQLEISRAKVAGVGFTGEKEQRQVGGLLPALEGEGMMMEKDMWWERESWIQVRERKAQTVKTGDLQFA